jgi:TRAP transporter TAXI family solute receptor
MSDYTKRWLAATLQLLVAAGFGLWTGYTSALPFNITTAAERGTYIQIGKDLAQFVAKPAGIDLGVLPSAGSIENVKRLRYDPGVKLAIVQQDVYQAFLDIAPIDRNAADIIRPLRVILPLYDEEIYFLVAADSPMNFVHEIKGQTINSGPPGSGTSLSVSTLYRAMFGDEPATSRLSNEDALVKLTTDKRGVVAIVGGQPTALLVNMKPEVRQYLKILRVDPDNPATKAALKTYSLSNVRQISYPNLLSADQLTFAVKALLVTYDFSYGKRQRPSATTLVKFARSLCDNLPVLQDSGHSKWRDVKIAFPDLGAGWRYYPPTTAELRKCATPPPSEPTAPVSTPDSCTPEKRILGLC